MIIAQLPRSEDIRLADLQLYDILHTAEEKEFDECCICDNVKLYYASYTCGHGCCLDCIFKYNKCYYKCISKINFDDINKRIKVTPDRLVNVIIQRDDIAFLFQCLTFCQ